MRLSDQIKIDRNKLLAPAIILSVWTAFGLFFGTQSYIQDAYAGNHPSLNGYLIGWLMCGYSWAILTVPVVRLVRRFSFDRLKWLRFFSIHVPLGIFFSLFQLALYVLIAGLLRGFGDRDPAEYYRFLVVQEFQTSFLVYFAIAASISVLDMFIRPRAVLRPAAGPDNSLPVENANAPAFLSRLSIKENGRIVFVAASDIDRIESYGNYVFVFAREKRHIVRETMNAMEKKLDPDLFVRIRRSAIVRIDKIKELRPVLNGEFEVVLKNDAVLASTRRYRKNLEAVLRS